MANEAVETKKEENPRRFSIERFESIMNISNTDWECLQDLYGYNIKSRLIGGEVSDGDLYDMCILMDTDYRYVLMLQDDYVISTKNPLVDPRKKITQFKKPSEKKDGVKKPTSKSRKRKYMYSPDRENNDFLPERFKEMFAESGLTFTQFRLFLGAPANDMRQFLDKKSFPKGTVTNTAWILETTPEYLTGKTSSPREGADDVIRTVMKNQNVLVKSDIISKNREAVRGDIPEDILLWLIEEDRMVSPEFAERLAKDAGVHISVLKSNRKPYKAEPSLVLVTRTARPLQEKLMEPVMQEPAEKIAADKPVSRKKASASTASKTKEQKAMSVKAQPAEEFSESGERKEKRKIHVVKPASLVSVIDAMDDETLDILIEYTETLRKVRELRKKLS